MSNLKYKILRLAAVLPAVAVLVLFFQNCSPVSTSSSSSNDASHQQMTGNGTGYEGFHELFANIDVKKPCAQLDTFGQPLPNREIMVRSSAFQLVRDECRDIVPQPLNAASVTVVDDSHLDYQGQSFAALTPDAFSVAMAACPAGHFLKAGATHTNLVVSPVNLLDTSVWDTMTGVAAALNGVFDGLPSFDISRTTINSEDFRRWDQSVDLQANHMYALSFMAKSGNASHARLTLFKGSIDSGGVWDLTTGAATDSFNSGLISPSMASRAIPGGYFLTYYFTMPASENSVDFGMSSDERAQGSYISVTGVQLEDVADFCN